MVYRQKISDTDQLKQVLIDSCMGSAKPGHTELSDWSAAKKTEDGYQGKGRSRWIYLD